MNTNTVTARIAGRDYTLSSGDTPEHMRRMADFVDRKMKEMSAAGISVRETAAVMAALTIADELIKSQDDNTRLRRMMDERA